MANGLLSNSDPLKDQIAAYDKQIADLKAQLQQKSTGTPATNLGFNPAQISQIYGLLAAGADDPTAVGRGYVGALQQQQQLAQQQASMQQNEAFRREKMTADEAYRQKQLDLQYAQMAQQRRADLTGRSDVIGSYVRLANNNIGVVKSVPPSEAAPNGIQVVDTGVAMGDKYKTFEDQAGNQYMMDPVRGQVQKIVGSSQVEEYEQERKDIADQANALRNFPAFNRGLTETEDLINSLVKHPARESFTGLSTLWATPKSYIPGTSEAEFASLQRRLHSDAFLSGLQQLRASGATLGQVTEKEGQKVQDAYTSLTRATSDEAYKRELDRLLRALQSYRESAVSSAKRRSRYEIDLPGRTAQPSGLLEGSQTVGDTGYDLEYDPVTGAFK